MARARVKPENRKNAAGAPPSIDIDSFLKMAEDLIEWSKNPPPGSYFKDFILDYPYTKSQIDHALLNSPEFKEKYETARSIFTRRYRQLAHQTNNRMYEKFMPLIDKDYKDWRMTELKLQAAANADPKAALEEIMNRSEKPVKE
jgi:hypothetical protein